MKNKQEIKEWILANCVDENGYIDLSGLDFSDFDGDVDISEMNVKNNLLQGGNKVGGYLQTVGYTLYHHSNSTKKNVCKNNNTVVCNLLQNNKNVKGKLYKNKKDEKQEDCGNILECEEETNEEMHKQTKSPQEIKEWILANCVDEFGNINLDHLDFSDFDGNVRISFMKTKNSLLQYNQEVGGTLNQMNQKVRYDLFQNGQIVLGFLRQDKQFVGKSLIQSEQFVGGSLIQDKLEETNND